MLEKKATPFHLSNETRDRGMSQRTQSSQARHLVPYDDLPYFPISDTPFQGDQDKKDPLLNRKPYWIKLSIFPNFLICEDGRVLYDRVECHKRLFKKGLHVRDYERPRKPWLLIPFLILTAFGDLQRREWSQYRVIYRDGDSYNCHIRNLILLAKTSQRGKAVEATSVVTAQSRTFISYTEAAATLGVAVGTISKWCRERKTARGYRWCRVEIDENNDDESDEEGALPSSS